MSDWVSTQSRTMARWVSAKVNAPIANLVPEVADGLVLVALVNRITAETGVSPYVLTPVHPKPTFRLHRLENVADVLQFCRLELNINTASVSAENVVDGDTKLILGLIWTLFVFATAQLMLTCNDAKSVAEIKTILLAWLNHTCRRRALPHIANFNADWSFQRLRRPDLVLACILDSYVPGAVDYDRLLQGKLLANMDHLCRLAESDFGIAPLAAVEDFNVLVPDEKCVLFYVLQWYLFFEALEPALDTAGGLESLDQASVAQFLALVLRAVKGRNKYDTMALRLVNQVNHAKAVLARLESRMADAVYLNLPAQLGHYCTDTMTEKPADSSEKSATEKSTSALEKATEPLEQSTEPLAATFDGIFAAVLAVRTIMADYHRFRNDTVPPLFYHDLPELESLLKSVQVELKQSGVSAYVPSKQLSLASVCDRLTLLDQLDSHMATGLSNYVNELRRSKLQSLASLVDVLHAQMGVATPVSPSLKAFVDGIDMLMVFKAELDVYVDTLRQSHTTADLRAIILSLETLDIPDTPMTPEQSGFLHFADLVHAENNTKNLTSSDVRDFFKRVLGPAPLVPFDMSLLLRSIPTRRLLVRSESDNLMLYASDDSDDQSAVFEVAQRNLEQKLSGNYNILYDLDGFVTRMDNGFRL